MLLNINELGKNKGSSTCIFLGSGDSINRISREQWNKLQKFDFWTVNNWVYHPYIVPDFYHVEAKWYNYNILKRRFLEKRDLYRDVKFIFPNNKKIKMRDNKGSVMYLHDIVFEETMKFGYDYRPRDSKRTAKIFDANYTMYKSYLTKSYDMSLTLIFELLYKIGYRRIITYGIDLHNSLYFWTNRPECGEVHHQTNKEHEGKDPYKPHATSRILHYIVDFNRRWMRPKNREILVGHRDTLLYPLLKYCEI